MSLLQGSKKVWIYYCRFLCASMEKFLNKQRFLIRPVRRRIPQILNAAMFIISNWHIISKTQYVRISITCPCTKFHKFKLTFYCVNFSNEKVKILFYYYQLFILYWNIILKFDVQVTVHCDKFLESNQLDTLISQMYFWNKSPHVSDSSSLHHQEFFSVHTTVVYVSKPVWHIPLLCVEWETPDDGQKNCPKHVQ